MQASFCELYAILGLLKLIGDPFQHCFALLETCLHSTQYAYASRAKLWRLCSTS